MDQVDDMVEMISIPLQILQGLAVLFVFVVGLVALWAVILFVIDISQTENAVRRNFPVIGRFRYVFIKLGEFFRQYFFAMDREEMPFNRAERGWVNLASEGGETTTPFGSTRDLRPTGTVLFVNCPFPTLDEDASAIASVTIGPYTRKPYTTHSIFNISAMSYGAISKPAVLALSNGARKAGIWMNSGEGGLSPYHLEGGADIVFQVGTAKYGIRGSDGLLDAIRLAQVAAHDSVRMFELKMSQGAKPGKGGILPGTKVTPEVARIRGIPTGKDSISPNRHPEINDANELIDYYCRIRDIANKPVGFKAVIGAYGWLDALFDALEKRPIEDAPDFITIDSADGGTGAAPMSLMDSMGLPLRESLPLAVDILRNHGLKERVKVIASGKLVTPPEAAWALCAGADFVASARGFMFALGCIQALQCNRNTCPTGITTHNKRLQRGLDPIDKSERVRCYADAMHHELGVIAHSCGVTEPRRLRRFHCRIVTESGTSIPLDELYPELNIA